MLYNDTPLTQLGFVLNYPTKGLVFGQTISAKVWEDVYEI